FLSGCAPSLQNQWSELPPAAQLLNKLALQSGQHRSLDAEASVSLTARGKYFSSQQFLLLERPDHLRADVLTGFGQLVLQLASDGEYLAVFLNDSVPGRFFHGPASYANISRFIRIPLAANDLLALLLYDPPLIVYQESRVLIMSDQLGLMLTAGDNRQELLFDARMRLIGSRYYAKNELQLKVDYEKISEADMFPRKVKIEVPGEETRVTLAYSQLELNKPIDPAKFRLKKPVNIDVETLP
ncbi:MAG: DUF4292 domain-containing protein, partial [Deltaproteobacteria bacterium]|nr:DUF4292 domain-containing protein [Deltaproteobacteria bacterium]